MTNARLIELAHRGLQAEMNELQALMKPEAKPEMPNPRPTPGRPKKTALSPASSAKPRRTLSEEAKEKIRAGQARRWAKAKDTPPAAETPTTPEPTPVE